MAVRHFLGNEKMFPLHADAWGYYPDATIVTRSIEDLQKNGPEAVLSELGDRPYRPSRFRRLYRKTKAQFNDPICLYAVLQTLIHSQRGIYIRPQYLSTLLAAEYPLYFWNNHMLGRVLSGLNLACKEEYPEQEDPNLPFARGRDGKGTYYVVDPKGGNEGLLWLTRCRDTTLTLAEDLMVREQAGHFDEDALAAERYPGDYYTTLFSGTRIRDLEFYIGNQSANPGWVQSHLTKVNPDADPLG